MFRRCMPTPRAASGCLRPDWLPEKAGQTLRETAITHCLLAPPPTRESDHGEEKVLIDALQVVGNVAFDPTHPADLLGEFEATDARLLRDQTRFVREGQGAFRVRLLEAYGGRCAVTGEHAAPVLDAAHIQPYLGPRSNHIQNGLVLRTDLHRLYDEGYVTVTPDYRFAVSPRLRDEFENGKTYYEMEGRQVLVPRIPQLQPSRPALDWHATRVFR